jgi:hypothetical protein
MIESVSPGWTMWFVAPGTAVGKAAAAGVEVIVAVGLPAAVAPGEGLAAGAAVVEAGRSVAAAAVGLPIGTATTVEAATAGVGSSSSRSLSIESPAASPIERPAMNMTATSSGTGT